MRRILGQSTRIDCFHVYSCLSGFSKVEAENFAYPGLASSGFEKPDHGCTELAELLVKKIRLVFHHITISRYFCSDEHLRHVSITLIMLGIDLNQRIACQKKLVLSLFIFDGPENLSVAEFVFHLFVLLYQTCAQANSEVGPDGLALGE